MSFRGKKRKIDDSGYNRNKSWSSLSRTVCVLQEVYIKVSDQGSLGTFGGSLVPTLDTNTSKTSPSEHSNVHDVLDEVIAHVGDCPGCSEKAEMLESIRSDITSSAGPSGRGGNAEEREDTTTLIENCIIRPGGNKFCDLIGHDEVKLLLVQSLALPIKQPQLFDNAPPCRRILLYGPPGKDYPFYTSW